MIEFKIISTPDKSQQATYQHLGRELVFGKAEGDMVVDDPAWGNTQLRVKLEGSQATIENLNLSLEARLNGKPISGAVPLKEKDNLTVARTTINFVRLDLSPMSPPDPYEHPQNKARVVDGSKEKAILDVLETLEKQTADAAPASPPKPPVPGAKPAAPPPLPKRG